MTLIEKAATQKGLMVQEYLILYGFPPFISRETKRRILKKYGDSAMKMREGIIKGLFNETKEI